jgi:hypothetical protein
MAPELLQKRPKVMEGLHIKSGQVETTSRDLNDNDDCVGSVRVGKNHLDISVDEATPVCLSTDASHRKCLKESCFAIFILSYSGLMCVAVAAAANDRKHSNRDTIDATFM